MQVKRSYLNASFMHMELASYYAFYPFVFGRFHWLYACQNLTKSIYILTVHLDILSIVIHSTMFLHHNLAYFS